jgi:hypothetical protein
MQMGLPQANVLHISKVSKPMLVRLASSNMFNLLGIPMWGMGPSLHVMVKVEKDEDLAKMI